MAKRSEDWSTGQVPPRAPGSHPGLGGNLRMNPLKTITKGLPAWVRQNGVSSGARRTMPPLAWLRAPSVLSSVAGG